MLLLYKNAPIGSLWSTVNRRPSADKLTSPALRAPSPDIGEEWLWFWVAVDALSTHYHTPPELGGDVTK